MGLVVVVVVVAVLGTSLVIRAREADIEDQWKMRANLVFEGDSVRQSLDALKRMADESGDPAFAMSSLLSRGSRALRFAVESDDLPDPQFNEIAKDSYEAALQRFGGNPLALGRAHLGLATVAENEFAIDGDLAHKEVVRAHLTAVLDAPELERTPFYRLAQERRDSLDKVLTPVAFAPAPDPDETPENPEPGIGEPIHLDLTNTLKSAGD